MRAQAGRRGEGGAGVVRARLDLRLLLGAFAAVAALFFAANAVSQLTMRRIDGASDAIALDAAPSTEHLGAIRTWVRQLELLAATAAADGDARARAAVAPALSALAAEVEAYLALPPFPGERGLWREVQLAHGEFDAAVRRALARLEADLPRHEPATAGIASAAERLSDAAARALEFNAREGRRLAVRIKEVRRRAARIDYALNAACLGITALAALIIRRHLRRYRNLVERQAELEEARASELESFAGRAAHDIHNPVSAAQLALSLVLRRGLPDGRSAEQVERALRSLARVRTIVDGLLQFARAGARPTPGVSADVPKVIEDVAAGVRPAADADGIELRVEPVEPCHAACSAGVLTSILSNLVQNAVKYMTPGAPARRITVRAEARGEARRGSVHVEVEDTGPGIPPDSAERIFLPYERGASDGKGGLGLGLATVRRLCESHGGRAGVRSQQGQGSVFWFELPSCAPEPRAASPARESG